MQEHRIDDEMLGRAVTGGLSDREAALVRQWRAQSEVNETRYHEIESMLEAVVQLEASKEVPPSPSARDLLRRAALRHRVRPLEARRSFFVWVQRVAALLILTLGTYGVWRVAHTGDSLVVGELATGESDLITLTLSDGTHVRLGPDTKLRVSPRDGAREVWLDGRAEFSVAKREGHPFTVHTPAGDAIDLGTRFLIRTDGSDMQLAVLEGRVAVSTSGGSAEVAAGQRSTVVQGGEPQVAEISEEHSALEWLQAVLVFEGMPLAQAAARLGSRYHLRVEVGDEVIAKRTVTAWFVREPTPRQAIVAICRAVGAQCSIKDSAILISARTPNPR